jgi:hypothetical protein
MSYVSFYDQEQLIGVTISRHVEEPTDDIEVMVSDQSVYYPETFSVQLSPGLMRLSLPPGTVSPDDGGDEHIVHFSISDDEYRELKDMLKYLLEGRAQFKLLDDGADGAA